MLLKQGVEVLKGVGPKKRAALQQAGISTLGELLYYFPRKHLDRTVMSTAQLEVGEVATVFVTSLESYLAHGKKSRLVVTTKTESNMKLSLLFFKGVSYFKSVLKPGLSLIVTGKLEYYRGMQIVHPDFEILSSETDPEESKLTHTGRIIPLYPTTEAMKKEGLDSRGLRRLNQQVLQMIEKQSLEIPEILPTFALDKRKLLSRRESIIQMHFPESQEQVDLARRRFIYEEFFFFSLLLELKRKKRQEIQRELWPLQKSTSASKLVKDLPFTLTEEQKNAVKQFRKLGQNENPMAVLLQGDVGSGKTITALLTALYYIDNEIQVCLLAPTEILARQHYQTIYNLLGQSPFLKIELFLGKERVKAKREKLHRLQSGETLLTIGTHSLLQESVLFKDLGLVVIDEQHKFGVEQRETLRAKGKNPDILAMTATPIPRTLCLTLYGDLELVTIKQKPAGRKPIDTRWYYEDKRKGVYKSIKKYLEQGRQCFIVYPLVEESEKLDLQSCIDAYESLQNGEFADYKLGLLHGKMKNDDKDTVMTSFQKGEIQVLITTTVVEVGIDVPNANILVVEHSERFGISQLHQLRGRVGRGEHQSFCILMTSYQVTAEAKARLAALTETEDGFLLAEKDLEIRGPGEVLGIRQSGLPDFHLGDLQKHKDILEEAREDAVISKDVNEIEKTEIISRFSEGRILFSN
ncbi:MAG: ATP-dependent DNA helicase RecG [Spirochaetota bacterium]